MVRYTGVYETQDGRYEARVSQSSIGTFDSDVEAAYVYDIVAEATYGDAAILNFPAESPATFSEVATLDS